MFLDVQGREDSKKMGEEARLHYIGERRGGYRDNKGGDNDGKLYSHCCFERHGREEDNQDKSASVSSVTMAMID